MPVMYPDDRNSIQREDLLAWGTVRAALALAFVGGLLTFISIFVIVAVTVSTGGQLQGRQALTAFVQMGCGLGLITGFVLAVAGACMMCAAPPEAGVKGWGIGTCVFVAIGLVLVSVLVIAKVNAEGPRLGPDFFAGGNPGRAANAPFGQQEAIVLGYASQGAYLLGVGCFLLCLRAIAQHFGRPGLAIGVVAYLLVYFLYAIGLNVLTHVQLGVPNANQAELMMWIILGGGVMLGVWGIVLVGVVRSALTTGMLRV